MADCQLTDVLDLSFPKTILEFFKSSFHLLITTITHSLLPALTIHIHIILVMFTYRTILKELLRLSLGFYKYYSGVQHLNGYESDLFDREDCKAAFTGMIGTTSFLMSYCENLCVNALYFVMSKNIG